MRILAAGLVALILADGVQARAPSDAPALPAPAGKVVKVSNVQELYRAASGVQSGTTIFLQKGTYNLDNLVHIAGSKKNIAIRGATGKYEDVVLRGPGLAQNKVRFGIMADQTDGLVIADLTIGWVGAHPIMIQPPCKNIHIYHCRLVDAGEQFVKASSNGKGGGADNGKVEYCLLEYTGNSPANGYTNGVDVHGGKNWIIRHNFFRNIRTSANAANKHVPAVLMWNGAANTICECNTFINCDRAIAFGLDQKKFPDHQGGIIRNNFIWVGKGEVKNVDAGIYVVSPGTKVLHNTIILNGGYPNAIETRFGVTKNVEVVNNVVDGAIVARDGARMTNIGTVSGAKPAWFRDYRAGDLHLTAGTPVKPAKAHLNCTEDWDGSRRGSPRTMPGAHDPAAKKP